MMEYRKRRTGLVVRLAALSLAGLILATAAQAGVVITTVGDGNAYDESGSPGCISFRSTNVVKSFDVDGDAVYGSDGYFFFGIGGDTDATGQPFTRNTQVAPSWVTAFAQGADFSGVAELST